MRQARHGGQACSADNARDPVAIRSGAASQIERDQRRRAVWLTEERARRLEAALPVWRSAYAALSQILDADRAQQVALATQALTDD